MLLLNRVLVCWGSSTALSLLSLLEESWIKSHALRFHRRFLRKFVLDFMWLFLNIISSSVTFSDKTFFVKTLCNGGGSWNRLYFIWWSDTKESLWVLRSRKHWLSNFYIMKFNHFRSLTFKFYFDVYVITLTHVLSC